MAVAPMTRRMLELIDASPTPFHAVAEVARRLEAAGWQRFKEEDVWSLEPGTRGWVTRNGSTLIAFEVGREEPARAGFRVVGAHTDSPNLRLKPSPEVTKEGYRQLAVEPYGGLILATWLDRDLSLAGRVFVQDREEPLLLCVRRPLCRIPNVAIHLNREVNEKGLLVNPQQHMPPLLGLEPAEADPAWFKGFLGRELGIDAPILSFDLMLFDLQPSTVSGLEGEFVHAPRLDNLASCHAGMEALLAAAAAGPAPFTRAIALWDHEEVGSQSAEGAGSPVLQTVLERITLARGGTREDLHRATSRSLLVSADMAHALHPNWPDKHEPRHQPRINQGPVLKINSEMRYATNADTAARFERLARKADVTLQRFVTRSDLRCGSTIGPISAARLGMPTVDVGNPMLSMHSVREMCGSQDQEMMVRVLTELFRA